jgi:transposase-like protein
MEGRKVPLGFIQGATEHHQVCLDLLNDLKARGFSFSGALLVIIDGGKGLRKAVELVFGHKAVIQRCQWHKRENVLKYLAQGRTEGVPEENRTRLSSGHL